MMCSGKSTVGRLLSDATRWPLHDNDALLNELYGMTPNQIVERKGERALRLAEDEALIVGLRRAAPAIVDAAAGTVASHRSRRLLAAAPVVWLRARPETLHERAVRGGGQHRPWLQRGAAWFRATAKRRALLYASVADLTIDTDRLTPREVASEILDRLDVLCAGDG